MKICHVMDSGGMYGKEHVVFELIKQQTQHNHNVTLIVLGNAFPALIEKSLLIPGITIIYMGFKAGMKWRHIKSLSYQVNKDEYNIVHSHGIKESIYLVLGGVKASLVRTLHGYTSTTKLSFKYIKECIDRILFARHDVVVGVSQEMLEHYNIGVIDNGISMVEFHHHKVDENIKEVCKKSWVFGCITRLSEEKNVINLVKAFKPLNSTFKLLLIGDGPLSHNLHAIVSEDMKDRVILTGFLPNAADYLSLMDVYIQPSYTEGMPISVLEAMSCGKQIMMSDVGGMSELLELGVGTKCGQTSEELTKDIKEVSQNLKIFDQHNQDVFKERFSSETMYQKYMAIYNRVID